MILLFNVYYRYHDINFSAFTRRRQIFGHPESDRNIPTALPVPPTNRRLSQLMRRHNR